MAPHTHYPKGDTVHSKLRYGSILHIEADRDTPNAVVSVYEATHPGTKITVEYQDVNHFKEKVFGVRMGCRV